MLLAYAQFTDFVIKKFLLFCERILCGNSIRNLPATVGVVVVFLYFITSNFLFYSCMKPPVSGSTQKRLSYAPTPGRRDSSFNVSRIQLVLF
jgi:hypothetical protein